MDDKNVLTLAVLVFVLGAFTTLGGVFLVGETPVIAIGALMLVVSTIIWFVVNGKKNNNG